MEKAADVCGRDEIQGNCCWNLTQWQERLTFFRWEERVGLSDLELVLNPDISG